MNVNIEDLQINPRIIAAAKRAGFSDGKAVLSLSSAELERLTGASTGDITQLKDAVSEAVLGLRAVTGLQMWKEEQCEETRSHKLSTGCAQVDQILRGGLLLKGITEVTGESGAGKTQLCLQLCLTIQLPFTLGGLSGGAIYISTEGAFPNKRLNQMARQFSKQYASVLKHNVTDHILLEHVADFDGLKECLHKKLPLALAQGRVKLVVVDSVAALFRCHYDSHSLVGRAKHLASLAMELRYLADHYNIAVVCVNQVTANMSKANDGSCQPRQSIPALGLVWADHVACRLLLSRREDTLSTSTHKEHGLEDGPVQHVEPVLSKRQLEVVFAPHLAQTIVPLVISHSGISHDV